MVLVRIMATPINFLAMGDLDVDNSSINIHSSSLGFHGGIKSNIQLGDKVTFVPFFMVNATQTWVSVSYSGSVDPETYDFFTVSPIFGFDILLFDYSLGAMVDWSETTTTVDIHLRIPLRKKYFDE